jgi:hypothetical protein
MACGRGFDVAKFIRKMRREHEREEYRKFIHGNRRNSMNANGNGSEPATATETQPKSIIAIEFTAPGSESFSAQIQGVTPAQLMLIAGLLQWNAFQHFNRVAVANAARQPQIVVPIMGKPNLPREARPCRFSEN